MCALSSSTRRSQLRRFYIFASSRCKNFRAAPSPERADGPIHCDSLDKTPFRPRIEHKAQVGTRLAFLYCANLDGLRSPRKRGWNREVARPEPRDNHLSLDLLPTGLSVPANGIRSAYRACDPRREYSLTLAVNPPGVPPPSPVSCPRRGFFFSLPSFVRMRYPAPLPIGEE